MAHNPFNRGDQGLTGPAGEPGKDLSLELAELRQEVKLLREALEMGLKPSDIEFMEKDLQVRNPR
jgi:hypothetical protein